MKSLKNIPILVSGGAGFLGSFLVRRLVKEKARVFVLAKKKTSKNRLKDILSQIQILEGDLTDENSIYRALKKAKPHYIFNVAGLRRVERTLSLLEPNLEANLNGVLYFFKAINKLKIPLKGFFQTGTLDEYGSAQVPFKENLREMPMSPYSASKLSATYFCQMLYRSLNFPITVLRPCLMYGPGQDKDMFIPSLIDACLKNQNFPMTLGKQTRDFGFVTDVVDAYVKALYSPKVFGEVINISTGKEVKIKDLAKKIVKITGSNTKLLFGKLPQRSGEVERMAGDFAKAKRMLKWSPTVKLEDGLIKTVQWYSSQKKIN